jgi:hypothetical protein
MKKLPANERRDELWQTIRELGSFTISEVIKREASLGRSAVRRYINSLFEGGYATREEIHLDPEQRHTGGQDRYRYKLIKGGPDSPVFANSSRQDIRAQVRRQIWRTMRVLKQFDVATLWAASGTEEHPIPRKEVTSYMRFLIDTRYLRRKRSYRKPVYVLVRDSGPKAPVPRRMVYAWDLNTRRYYEEGTGREMK